MALNSQSLILYGYNITTLNQNVDFQAVSGGPILTAQMDLGAYSLTGLLAALKLALQAADPANIYTVVADRTILGGLENRITISTQGIFLSLLFGSGPNFHTSLSSVIGFGPTDLTGLTSYTSIQTTGTALIPTFPGYSYSDLQGKVFGAVNVSASGLKTSTVFNIQNFIDIEFRYENLPRGSSRQDEWTAFWLWAIKQQPYDFTPEMLKPTVVYNVTLEKTAYESKGLGYQMKEMLPNFPNYYQTGNIKMRVTPDILATQFIS